MRSFFWVERRGNRQAVAAGRGAGASSAMSREQAERRAKG